ncbi:MAG: asparagine--tRNA ligase [Bacteriovoracaceae bacterium]|nr:asparagine--tRNA ligase [Bacteriovoracaceae bacterium]
MKQRLLIKSILEDKIVSQEATVKGWVRSVRKTKNFSFVVLNDGSTLKTLQVIVDSHLPNYENISTMLSGTSVSITGKLAPSQGKGQNIEMQAQLVDIIGTVDNTYPLQKKATSLEFLRENAHLRSRTNTFNAVFRIRHHLSYATHQFFHDRGFYYLHTPIITSQDCEGAGEMFRISTFDMLNPPKKENGEIDWSKDYFGQEANLTVSGQLAAECYALGMNAVYTFGPTFRSEDSNTSRHLAEFWMIEPEVAFADLEDMANLSSEYLKYLISHVFKHCMDELEFLAKFYCDKEGNKNHLESLRHVLESEFVKITYTEAIDILQKSGKKFEYRPDWGVDLQTEHERYLTEKHFKLPVIVMDYPKDIKAFYMKQNPDGKTVRGMDVLVPGVGELMGGAQREDDYQALERRMDEMNMNKKDLWWYLDLRKFGSAPHAGFGLGFERAVMYITGMSNIRDVIAFPRYPQNAEF